MEDRYERLEMLLKEVSVELKRLKMESDPNFFIPECFVRSKAEDFLRNPNVFDLDDAFTWDSTPQGEKYWEEIGAGCSEGPPSLRVPKDAIISVQHWIINSLKLEVDE